MQVRSGAPAHARRDQGPGHSAREQSQSRSRRHFRPDIEGLRAVAVLGVVLFHAHVGLLRGGFAGVDVFFVVSGYLITGLLWAELDRNGRISLPGFYARRARRLLPASILVIVVTMIAARHWLPPLQMPSVAKDGIASALYVGNYRFAFAQTNYLNGTTASPFQHYWSLGVEEQFYLLWPVLLIAASLLWRRRYAKRPGGRDGTRPDRWTAVAALAAVTGLSLLLSLYLTHANQPWAFFSLPTRAWELGAGGLLALLAPFVRRIPEEVAIPIGWAGLVTVVVSFFVISTKTPFPGTAALAPVFGTVAALAAGEVSTRTPAPSVVLGKPAMRLMGRISYSWYLWHWPVLILAPYALGYTLHLWQNLTAAAISGLLAIATYLLIENPARTSRWLSSVPRRSLIAGGSLTACGAIVCAVIASTLPSLSGHGIARVAKIRANSPAGAVHSRGSPATTLDPLHAQLASITAQINAQVVQSVGDRAVPANLTPTLTHAKHDDPPVFYDGCMDSYLASTVENCAFGDVAASTSVVLFGDSHAAMWFPGLDYAANQRNFRLLNWTKATCPPILLPIISPVLGRNFSECVTWRQNVLSRIATDHPAVVVLAMARHYTSIYGFTPYQQPWLQGLAQMITTIRHMGSKVMVIGPVPKPPVLVPDCLSAHLNDATACTVPTAQAINEAGMSAERATVNAAGGVYVDTQNWFCTPQTCTAMVGNLLVWRDDNHITATYSAFLGPALSAELAVVMGAG